MKVSRGFRYRLYPTATQEEAFGQWSGVCRLVYNLGWEQRHVFWRQYRRAHGRSISYFSQGLELTALRAAFDWIAAVPAAAEYYALRDVDLAFSNFFAGRGRYPRPRRRSDGHGFRVKGVSCQVRQLSGRWAEVRLPKLGWVRFRTTRPITGTIRNVSVKHAAGQWHVSFAIDWEQDAEVARPDCAGIDLGVARSITLSTGEHFSAPSPIKLRKRIVRAQRTLARRKKGSARYAAQRARVAALKALEGRTRGDWAHKTTSALADRFGMIVAEDLNIGNMTASAVGTVEEPGKNVAQKRALNRTILAQGWGQVTDHLAYKLEERGGALIFVDPKFTSQTCAECGAVDAKSRESQATFLCVHCGHADNADVNAAKEILRRGTAWRGVEAGVARSLKRQSKGLKPSEETQNRDERECRLPISAPLGSGLTSYRIGRGR